MDADTLVITLDQLHYLSGCYHSDSDFERDAKVTNWIGRRSYCIIDSRDDVANQPPGIQILIIKEN
jgi:hypothetical protein